MTQPSSSLASINPESLALSASLFTSQIASWIPADFGISSTNANSDSSTSSGAGVGNKQNQVDDFIQLATASDRNERLGLGHPLLSVPKNQRGGLGGSASLLGLSKRLGINSENGQIGKGMAKGKRKVGEEGEVGVGTGLNGTAPDARRSGGDEDDDEDESAGESRARIAKKPRKNAALDLLYGKKKKKKQQALLAAEHDVHSPHSKSAGVSNGGAQDASKAGDVHQAPTAQPESLQQPGSALERLERLGSLADATSGSRLHGVNSARDVNEEPTEPENKHAATSNDDQKEKAGMSSTARSPVGTPTAVGSSKTKKRREKRKEKQKQKQAKAGV